MGMNCHRAEVCVGKEAVTEAGTRPPCPTEQKEFPREGGKGLLLEQRAGLVQTCSAGLAPHLLRSWHDWIPQPTTLHSSQGRRATDQGTQHSALWLQGVPPDSSRDGISLLLALPTSRLQRLQIPHKHGGRYLQAAYLTIFL